MQSRLMVGFEPVGDHDIGAAGDELVEHAGVVMMDDDGGAGEMSAGESLVGRPRVGDQPHAGLVDRGDRGEAVAVLAARQGPLPSTKVGIEKNALSARAAVTVTPPIAISNPSARKSSSRSTQTLGTNAIATPSRAARSCAMSI